MGMALAVTDPVQAVESLMPVAVVTGATGFIGRYLCRALQDSGYRVKALARPQSAANAQDLFADETVLIELTDPALVDALRGASVVFNLAGKAHTGVKDRAELQASNVDTAAAIADAARAANVPRLIHFSSILARKPEQSPYAASKRAGEKAVLDRADDHFAVYVIRPASVYGHGMRGNWMTLIKLIAAQRVPPLPKLNNTLSLVSVQDLCRGVVDLAALSEQHVGRASTLLVTDGQRYTPGTIESAIYAALGRKKPRWHTPRVLFFAAAALAELLGRLGVLRTGFGLGSYQNLVNESPVQVDEERVLFELIHGEPGNSFISALPELIALARHKP